MHATGSCATCAALERHACGGFVTAADHVAADECVRALVDADAAEVLDVFSVRCRHCGAIWEMEAPDGASRGHLKRISPRQQRIDALAARLHNRKS
jgi:hypothetical protein